MQTIKASFKDQILEGIPNELPQLKPYDENINHAPKRKEILTEEEKKLALKNALRYFEAKHHSILIDEFKKEQQVKVWYSLDEESNRAIKIIKMMELGC